MTPYHERPGCTLFHADAFDALAAMPDASVDAVVTDPPYGIGFMGHAWDQFGSYGALSAKHGGSNVSFGGPPHPAMEAGRYDRSASANQRFQAWCEAWGRELVRVLKPGAHALVFGGSRTYHRLTAGLEDAGFEVRDSICVWTFASGFPKSLNLGAGRGTALKPAYEPVVMARAPLDGTIAATAAKHGTGALNIDATRIAAADGVPVFALKGRASAGIYGDGLNGSQRTGEVDTATGRWPANLVLVCCGFDEHLAGCPVQELDRQSGISASKQSMRGVGLTNSLTFGAGRGDFDTLRGHTDAGGASRFFWVAKPSRAERDQYLDDLPRKSAAEVVHRTPASAGMDSPRAGAGRTSGARNTHPTVKPQALMQMLCRLITPPGGVVLDPFCGSGSTGAAALLEGLRFVGIDREAEYLEIALRRMARQGMALWA